MENSLFILSVSLFFFAMSITPGPNNTVLLAVGLSCGFRPTIPHVLAVSVGSPLLLFCVGLGLDKIFVQYPFLQSALKYAGTAYILWLAWSISGLGRKRPEGGGQKSDHASADTSDKKKGRKSGVRPLTFFQALLFQLVNVKGWLAYIFVVSTYAGGDAHRMMRVAIMCFLMFFFCLTSTALWAAGGMLMSRFLTSEGVKRCNYLFALFLVLSIALLFI